MFAFAALHLAPRAVALIGSGVALVLLYFGAETFALHELGVLDAATALDLAERIRTGGTQTILFAAGLLLVAAGVIVALTVAVRAGRLPAVPAVVLGAAFLLYIPQFFAPPALRIAHGVLMLVACAWVAYGSDRPADRQAVPRAPAVPGVRSPAVGSRRSVGGGRHSDRSTTTGA